MRRPIFHKTFLSLLIAGFVQWTIQSVSSLLAQSDALLVKWESEIASFEAADKTNPPPKSAVLFVGGSSIRLWQTLAQDFPEHRVINRGFGGSHVADSVAFADRIIIPYKPKIIVLYAGDNDIADGKTPDQVLSDFKSFVVKIHKDLPTSRIAYVSIKPSLARWHLVDKIRTANQLIAEYSRANDNVVFIDIFTPMLDDEGKPRKELFVSDGLHLNAKGYELWTSVIKPHLSKR